MPTAKNWITVALVLVAFAVCGMALDRDLGHRAFGAWSWRPWAAGLCLIGLFVWLARLPWHQPDPASLPPHPTPRSGAVQESAPSKPPLSLRLVGYLITFGGIVTVIGDVVGIFFGRIMLDLTVLNIWAGRGLLRLSRGWRTFVLVEQWMWFMGIGLFAGILISGESPIRFTWFGAPKATLSPTLGWCLLVPNLLLNCWAYWVLTRPATRSLFARASAAAAP